MPVPGSDEPEGAALHRSLVEGMLKEGTISSPAVEAAFRAVPRHLFLPGMPLEEVYQDQAIMTKYDEGTRIPISSSSQPAIMAIMLEQLHLEPGLRVLEIGAGTGYNAALMAFIVGEAGQVVSVDIDADTVEKARAHLAAAGYARVLVLCADGGQGYADAAPYDRIILSVGASDVLAAWREQLKPGGRIVLPLSIRTTQVVVAFEQAADHLHSLTLQACRFMMLRGAFAEDCLRTQVGPLEGISLEGGDRHSIDADAIYWLLLKGGQDVQLDIPLSWHEMYFQLSIWLALHEPDLCRMTIDGAVAQQGILPALPPADGSGRRVTSAIGLLSGGSLCVLSYYLKLGTSAAPTSSALSPGWFIRNFGPDTSPAQRLLAHIQAWDGAGRPGLERLTIDVYPPGSPYRLQAGDSVIHRRWSRLVCAWR
jgi:protein-L-isoaspartate(D-aspartate) O-methyltransferase